MALVTANDWFPLNRNYFSGGAALTGADITPLQLYRIINSLAQGSYMFRGADNTTSGQWTD